MIDEQYRPARRYQVVANGEGKSCKPQVTNWWHENIARGYALDLSNEGSCTVAVYEVTTGRLLVMFHRGVAYSTIDGIMKESAL